ncbi:hypothetical protein Syun_013919 [Stephania yunnanensis]|uniref:Uncharacterized protein n=1 Tax=Stephania yunnanensis TaxID=152371 RepID=A0AAP0P936_9MAGN
MHFTNSAVACCVYFKLSLSYFLKKIILSYIQEIFIFQWTLLAFSLFQILANKYPCSNKFYKGLTLHVVILCIFVA